MCSGDSRAQLPQRKCTRVISSSDQRLLPSRARFRRRGADRFCALLLNGVLDAGPASSVPLAFAAYSCCMYPPMMYSLFYRLGSNVCMICICDPHRLCDVGEVWPRLTGVRWITVRMHVIQTLHRLGLCTLNNRTGSTVYETGCMRQAARSHRSHACRRERSVKVDNSHPALRRPQPPGAGCQPATAPPAGQLNLRAALADDWLPDLLLAAGLPRHGHHPNHPAPTMAQLSVRRSTNTSCVPGLETNSPFLQGHRYRLIRSQAPLCVLVGVSSEPFNEARACKECDRLSMPPGPAASCTRNACCAAGRSPAAAFSFRLRFASISKPAANMSGVAGGTKGVLRALKRSTIKALGARRVRTTTRLLRVG